MSSVRRLLVASVLATSAVTACSSDSTTDSFAPLALALTVTPGVDTIFVSDTILPTNVAQLAVSASSLNQPIATPSGIEWSSADPGVAAVDGTGRVIPRSIGTTTVTARINNSKAIATIVVAHQVVQVSLSTTSF